MLAKLHEVYSFKRDLLIPRPNVYGRRPKG
jgi:hypothetical protein